MYTALNLSKYIVSKCIEDGEPISNLQLQKILYYIQKKFLNDGKIAFLDDIQAWQFGPVVPEVYYFYCGYGSMPITSQYDRYEIESEDKGIIDEIIEGKRKLRPWELVRETHKKDGAWDRTYANGNGNRKVISCELIKADDK